MIIKTESSIHVRYSEVDKMGIVYYSKYFEYFEVGRIGWLKRYLLNYNEIEEKYRIGLPVSESFAKFILPVKYGDEIKVITTVSAKPKATIKFEYELLVDERLVAIGHTSNVFVNLDNFTPCRPKPFYLIFDQLFDNQ
jgi:acyl-CoA thioester hydrolase